MFIINSPEKPNLGSQKVRTLSKAITAKHHWQDSMPGTHAVITDKDGYVVTAKEQETYLLRPFRV